MKKEYIHLSIKPDWEYIGIFREFINNFFFYRINNRDKIYDISFIISELLENAFKYSSGGHVVIKINFSSVDNVEVVVKNQVKKNNVKELVAEIKKISGKPIEKVYKEKFEADSFWEEGKGSLGLIMISERSAGKIHFSYDGTFATIKCKISLKEISK